MGMRWERMFRRGLRGNGWELDGESGCAGKVRVCRMQGRKESGARGLWCRDMRFGVMWEYGVVWGGCGGRRRDGGAVWTVRGCSGDGSRVGSIEQ